MAFPVVESTATSATSTAGTNHVVTLPSGIQAGDLIVICMSIGNVAATLNAHADYSELLDENAAVGLKILYRWAAGGESNPTFVSSASTRDATVAFRISGAANPATQAPQIGTTATGTSVNPDPPTTTPTGGAKDYLWIAVCGSAGEQADDGTYATAFPSGYNSNQLEKTCGVAGTNLGGLIAAATKQANAASDNPGTFTVSENAAWRAQTIAVHPDPRIRVTLTAATETDTAPALDVDKPIFKSLTATAETDTAQALTVTKPIVKTLTPASETDAAQVLAFEMGAGGEDLIPAAETDSAVALSVTKPIVKTATPATETDAAQGLSFVKPIRKTLTTALETDVATDLSVSGPIRRTLNPGPETDTARALTVTKTIFKALTPATETDAAVALTRTKRAALGPAAETDAGWALTVIHPIRVTLTPSGETDAAQTLALTVAGRRWPYDTDQHWGVTSGTRWPYDTDIDWPYDTDQNWN